MSFEERCQVITADGLVVVFVDRTPWITFDEDDVVSKRFVMVQLAERELGSHAEIAATFALQSLSVDRYRKSFREFGVMGLAPKSKGPKGPRVTGGKIDRVIVAGMRAGQSKTDIAAKLAISRPALNAALVRLNYPEGKPSMSKGPGVERAAREESAELAGEKALPSASDAVRPNGLVEARGSLPPMPPTAVPVAVTWDEDPSNRSIDRALAQNGMLDDAAPLFADADGIRDVGALLAIPVLTQQGVFFEALGVFGGIGPAFYGLRTTIVCLCLLMMLNLSRLQDIMQREPRTVGKLLGLDRSPEVKTLRRKLRVLAKQGRSLQWMEALAKRQLNESRSDTTWLYIDGHVSVYSGKHRLREHHVACLRTARPSTLDYWVNQPQGDPLLVITGTPQEGLVRQVPQTIQNAKRLAPGRPITMIFDREGWSPKLFATIKETDGVHFLTYRKAASGKRLPRLAESLFTPCTTEATGRKVVYDLADTRVRICYSEGRRQKHVELRQITRRKVDGKQTHVLTDDCEKPAAELAHRMFGRWSQENYFKYAEEHRDLDALVTQEMDPADGTRLVPNPERVKLRGRLGKLREQLRTAHEEHGRRHLGTEQPNRSSDAAHAAHVQAIDASIARVQTQVAALPARIAWSATGKGQDAVQPRIEVRRLMHTFRMAAHRAESALLELLRPHFPDWRNEGRALTRAILHSSGSLRVTATKLHVTIHPLASPYKTRALAALCNELTRLESAFPGTNLKMVFDVKSA